MLEPIATVHVSPAFASAGPAGSSTMRCVQLAGVVPETTPLPALDERVTVTVSDGVAVVVRVT